MISKYVANVGFVKDDICDFRINAGELDITIDERLEKLLDEDVMETTSVHAQIASAIDEVEKVCGLDAATFYNEIYVAVLNELLNRTVVRDGLDDNKTD